MPFHRRVLVHTNGPALWPDHRPLENVLEKRDGTPPITWFGTYQGLPTPPGGTVFREKWWGTDETRFDNGDGKWSRLAVGRYVSVDVAESENQDAAYTAAIVAELTRDYRLMVRQVWRERVSFPQLEDRIKRLSTRWNQDEKLRGIVIENASNGTALIQTLMQVGELWMRKLVASYSPSLSKEERANQASVWCQNGMVLLPYPNDAAPWLADLEDELFNFPGGEYKDQVDAFSQLILYLEHYLARGWRARRGTP